MEHSDQTLTALQQKVTQKKHLDAKLAQLREQKRTYDRKMVELRVAYTAEQGDVDKLKARSLANYFYQVIGRIDEMISKEEQEAYAAKVKLDAAQRELAGVESDIAQVLAQLKDLHGCEEAYADELNRRRNLMKSAGTPEGARIMELEERIAALEAQKKEIREAASVGYSARSVADRVLSALESADDWNTWDMLGGGGIITHMAKHSHLDDAQELVEQLQGYLRRFKTELADIRIDADMQVGVDGFLRFADYFFDGLFADWAVGSRINSSMSSVQRTRSQISATISKLDAMEAAADREIAMLKGQLEQIALGG